MAVLAGAAEKSGEHPQRKPLQRRWSRRKNALRPLPKARESLPKPRRPERGRLAVCGREAFWTAPALWRFGERRSIIAPKSAAPVSFIRVGEFKIENFKSQIADLASNRVAIFPNLRFQIF